MHASKSTQTSRQVLLGKVLELLSSGFLCLHNFEELILDFCWIIIFFSISSRRFCIISVSGYPLTPSLFVIYRLDLTGFDLDGNVSSLKHEQEFALLGNFSECLFDVCFNILDYLIINYGLVLLSKLLFVVRLSVDGLRDMILCIFLLKFRSQNRAECALKLLAGFAVPATHLASAFPCIF